MRAVILIVAVLTKVRSLHGAPVSLLGGKLKIDVLDGFVAWLKHARRKPLHYRPLEDYLAESNRK